MAQRYYNVLGEIQESASDVISFTASAFDAQLQVEATQQATSLDSSKNIADLYYSQFQINYNVTNELAMQVRNGPPPKGGDSFDDLIDKCRRQLIIKAIFKVAVATAKLTAGFAGAFVEEGVKAAAGAVEEAGKIAEKEAETDGESSLKGALDLAGTATEFVTTSKEMLDLLSGVQSAYTWDPDLQLPTLPTAPNGTDPIDQDFIDASSAWYLAAQKNLSAPLVQLSPAFWANFYLEADNNFSPILNDPPECGAAGDITKSIREYLNTVQNFTNYGDAMTTAAMSLAPVLGNIATAIATLGAIDQASQSIIATFAPPMLAVQTAPPSQFPPRPAPAFPEHTKQILAYLPSLTWLNNAYLAGFSVYQFCQSFAYMNANQAYPLSSTASSATNCVKFGSLYVPSAITFNSFVSSLVSQSTTTPSSVKELSSNLKTFAQSVEDGGIYGGSRGSAGQSGVSDFSILIPEDSTGVFGDVRNGIVNFRLQASSDLLASSPNGPFGINDANPRVVDVEVYWRNVMDTTGALFPLKISSRIYVGSSQAVYTAGSGKKVTYTLPPFDTSDVPDLFGTFQSIQPADGQQCASTTTTNPVWSDGTRSEFCIDNSLNFQLSSSSAFVYPSLWTNWRIEAESFDYFAPTGPVELQVIFKYVRSSASSPEPVTRSYQACRSLERQEKWDYHPLATDFCDQSDCTSCGKAALALMDNVTQSGDTDLAGGFCLCNIWTGACVSSDTCHLRPPPVMSMMLTPATTSSSRRSLKAKNMIINLGELEDITNSYLFEYTRVCLMANPSLWNVTGFVRQMSLQMKLLDRCKSGTLIVEMSFSDFDRSFQGPVEQCVQSSVTDPAYLSLLQRHEFEIEDVQMSGSNAACADDHTTSSSDDSSGSTSHMMGGMMSNKGASKGSSKGKEKGKASKKRAIRG